MSSSSLAMRRSWRRGLLSIGIALAQASSRGFAADVRSTPNATRPPQETSAPAIRIVTPSAGQAVNGHCRIVIEAGQGPALTHVAIYRDGSLLESDFAPPFEVTWDTRREANGPYALLARAFGVEFGEVSSSPTTVTVDNTPPTVSVVAPRDGATVIGVVQIDIEASDNVGVQAVELLLNGQELERLDHSPYRFRWDTDTIFNGKHTLQARAIDTAGNGTSSAALTLSVVNQNRPPVLSPIGPKTVTEETTLTFRLQARDPDGSRDPLHYEASNLPSWASLDPRSGGFRGRPTYQEASLAEPTKVFSKVVFAVCDPEPLCATESVTISVLNANRPPVVEPLRAAVVREGEPLTITVRARDPDQDPLTCQAEHLPPWMSVEASACRLQGTPGADAASQEKRETAYPGVRIEVCDPQPLCDSQELTITVVDRNRPPAWQTISHQAVEEGRLLLFTVKAADPDGDQLSLGAAPLASGARFIDHRNGTGTCSWTPQLDQSGDYAVVFSASDGALSDQQMVRIAVGQKSLTISGTIKDRARRPLVDATVQLNQVTGRVKEVTTDAQGFYLADGLKPGIYTVRPSHQLVEEFTTTPKKLGAVSFRPSSQRVVLDERDQTGVDFEAFLP